MGLMLMRDIVHRYISPGLSERKSDCSSYASARSRDESNLFL